MTEPTERDEAAFTEYKARYAQAKQKAMKRHIYKYTLKITDTQVVEMPEGAGILTVQMQHGNLCLWALVKPELPTQSRYIRIIGTGNPVPDESLSYIATAQAGPLVWHIFEREP